MSSQGQRIRWNPEKDLLNEARLVRVLDYFKEVGGILTAPSTRMVYSIIHVGGAATGAVICQDFNNLLLFRDGQTLLQYDDALAAPHGGTVFPALARLETAEHIKVGSLELPSGNVHFYETTTSGLSSRPRLRIPSIFRAAKSNVVPG